MGLREKINENQNIIAVVAIVILVGALIYIFTSFMGGGVSTRPGKAWYYDTVTHKYFKDAANLLPPIKSKDGNPSIRAHFFTCKDKDCSAANRILVYYDKYTDQAKAAIAKADAVKNPTPDQMGALQQAYQDGERYSFDGQTWYRQEDPAYSATLNKKLRCPNGQRPRGCGAGR